MQLTSVLPPAYQLVRDHGDLLTQLGASRVEATDSSTIHLTFTDNSAAVHADALLEDTVRGAKLVVDNASGAREPVLITPEGIANVLRGVPGLHVQTLFAKGVGGRALVSAGGHDGQVISDLALLTRHEPAPGIGVSLFYTQQAQDGS